MRFQLRGTWRLSNKAVLITEKKSICREIHKSLHLQELRKGCGGGHRVADSKKCKYHVLQ